VGERNELAGHVFISYVRENSVNVDQLQRTLESAGVRVWRDTANLWPGEDWRAKIRQAITGNALVFIACFSPESIGRTRGYQNEELILAIEQLRLRRPGEPWLIPVRFDDCDIPDLDIGMGRTLASIQRADLFGDRSPENAARIVEIVLRMLKRRSASMSPTAAELEPVVTTPLVSETDFDIEGGWSKPESRSEPRVEIRMASDWLAKQLRIDQGSQVVSRHQRRWKDSRPWTLQTSFYSMEFVRMGATRLVEASNISEGMARYLTDTLYVKLSTSRDEIGVRKPDSHEAAFLQIPEDGRVQVLEVNRTIFDQNGIPALLTVIVSPPDRNRIVYEQRIRRL
jgi:TIR domain/UTRA domain